MGRENSAKNLRAVAAEIGYLHVNRTINETLRHDQAHAAPRHNCIKSSKARCNASDNYGCSEWWLVLLEPVAR